MKMSDQLAIDFGATNSVVAGRATGPAEVCFVALSGLSGSSHPPLAEAVQSPDLPARQTAEYLIRTYRLKAEEAHA